MLRHPPTLLLSFLLPVFAHAEDLGWSKIQCLPLASLDVGIHFCTENTLAVLQAQACSARLSGAWTDAARDLSLLQEGSTGGQRLDFGRSQERYDTAVERVRSLLALTRRNTDLLAQYPTVMVDAPGVASWSDSLPCYREAYDQLQQTVTLLDRKMAEGRRVLASASRLRENLKRLADGVKSGGGSAASLGQGLTGSPAPTLAAQRAPASGSDITGLKKTADLNKY